MLSLSRSVNDDDGDNIGDSDGDGDDDDDDDDYDDNDVNSSYGMSINGPMTKRSNIVKSSPRKWASLVAAFYLFEAYFPLFVGSAQP